MSGPGATSAQRGYVICTEPRSGSIYLCQLLASTGVLGVPTEYFNVETMRLRGHADYPTDPEAQLAAIAELGATPNGVYGLKIFSRQFRAVAATRWAERLPSLSFLHLTRLDALGQAISHVRAMQTQQWTARSTTRGAPRYDFSGIKNELVRLLNAQAGWSHYLARNGVPVLHIAYEQMIAAPQQTADAVARFVGLGEPASVDPSQLWVTPQRDGLNAEWRERFVAEARGLATFP